MSSWIKDTGFRSDFCCVCGSPVPNPLRQLPHVWVPAGLLDDDGRVRIGMQVFVGSRALWDAAALQGTIHETCPALGDFVRALHSGSHDSR